MEKKMTLNEVKALTRDELIEILKERGYDAKVYVHENSSIMIYGISREESINLCAEYGATGGHRGAYSILACWGYFSTPEEEFTYGEKTFDWVVKELKERNIQHNTYQTEFADIIAIPNMSEKDFRRLAIEFNVYQKEIIVETEIIFDNINTLCFPK